MSYAASSGNDRDTAYTTDATGILLFKNAGYELDGIGRLHLSALHAEPSCIPAGAVRLYRLYNASRDDYAIFPESGALDHAGGRLRFHAGLERLDRLRLPERRHRRRRSDRRFRDADRNQSQSRGQRLRWDQRWCRAPRLSLQRSSELARLHAGPGCQSAVSERAFGHGGRAELHRQRDVEEHRHPRLEPGRLVVQRLSLGIERQHDLGEHPRRLLGGRGAGSDRDPELCDHGARRHPGRTTTSGGWFRNACSGSAIFLPTSR